MGILKELQVLIIIIGILEKMKLYGSKNSSNWFLSTSIETFLGYLLFMIFLPCYSFVDWICPLATTLGFWPLISPLYIIHISFINITNDYLYINSPLSNYFWALEVSNFASARNECNWLCCVMILHKLITRTGVDAVNYLGVDVRIIHNVHRWVLLVYTFTSALPMGVVFLTCFPSVIVNVLT